MKRRGLLVTTAIQVVCIHAASRRWPTGRGPLLHSHSRGAKASRPELDKALASANRAGDQLVITRVDQLGRSVLHLGTLGADLRERGVGLRVHAQGFDTTTVEGRARFRMLPVLVELQRELIIAKTRDGLEAARARGRTGGRRPKLTSDQAQHAQQLYHAGEHTVQRIADLLQVPRFTIYGYLNKTSTDDTHPRAVTRRNSGANQNLNYLAPLA